MSIDSQESSYNGRHLPIRILLDSTEVERELDGELFAYRILNPKEAFHFSTSIKPIIENSKLPEILEILDLAQYLSDEDIEKACEILETPQTNSIIHAKLLDTFFFSNPLPYSIKGHIESIVLNRSQGFGNLIERLFEIK